METASARCIVRAAAAVGLIELAARDAYLEIVDFQEWAIEDVQAIRRKLRSPPGKGRAGDSLWEYLKVEDKVACFTWRQPNDGYRTELLATGNLRRMLEDPDTTIGVDGSFFPDEVPLHMLSGIRFYPGAWSKDRQFLFALAVSLDSPGTLETSEINVEEQVVVHLFLRPVRGGFKHDLVANRIKGSRAEA